MEPFAAGGEGGTAPGGRLRSRRRRSASGPFGSAWRGPRPSALSSMGPGCDAFVYDQDLRSGGGGGGLRLLPRCVGLGGFGGRRLAGGRCGAGVSRPRVAPSFSAVRPVVLQRPGCRTPPDALIQQRCMRLAGRRPRPTGSGAAWFAESRGSSPWWSRLLPNGLRLSPPGVFLFARAAAGASRGRVGKSALRKFRF